jgi:MFS superfamily sulfate permease-like transporter
MRTTARLFWVLAAFCALLAIVYAVWSWLYDRQGLATDPSGGEASATIEWAGTTALGLCAVLFTLIAFYLTRLHRSLGGELPEDIESANIDDGDPEAGHFSPWSWWPVTLGGSLALVFLGLAVGPWIAIIGATLALIAIVGWTYEYYRGYFGR